MRPKAAFNRYAAAFCHAAQRCLSFMLAALVAIGGEVVRLEAQTALWSQCFGGLAMLCFRPSVFVSALH